MNLEYLKSRVEKAKILDDDAISVDVEELASVVAYLDKHGWRLVDDGEVPDSLDIIWVEALYEGLDFPVMTVGFAFYVNDTLLWNLDYDSKAKRKKIIRWKYIDA